MGNKRESNWDEYEKLVLNELQRHDGEVRDLREKISGIRMELTALKERAGIYATALTALSSLAGVLGAFLRSLFE